MESTQRSSGLRARTRGARLENGLNLFGTGMNLGPLRPPPAAARTYQIHVFPLFPLAPLVCLAFSAPLGAFSLFRRARCPHRANPARAEGVGITGPYGASLPVGAAFGRPRGS